MHSPYDRSLVMSEISGADGTALWHRLFKKYDTDSSGDLGLEEFIKAVRGEAKKGIVFGK